MPVPTNLDIITALGKDRDALAHGASGLGPVASQYIWNTIYDINNEIQQLVLLALDNAPYVPQTDPFKAVTAAGKQFIGTLNDIKTTFANAAAIVGAAEDVINILLKL